MNKPDDAVLVVAERLDKPGVQLDYSLRGVCRDIDPFAVTWRFVHHLLGTAETPRNDVIPFGDLLGGIALTRGRSGRSRVILEVRHRRAAWGQALGVGQIAEKGKSIVPGVFGEIEFDCALLGRATDGGVEPVFAPIEIEHGARAIGAGLAYEIVANCFRA